MKKSLLAKVGGALVGALCLTFMLGMSPALAADPGPLSESGTEITAADAKEIALNTSGASCVNFDGSSTKMEVGTEYSIIYPNSLTYGGKTLSVKVTAKLTNEVRLDSNGKTKRWVVRTDETDPDNKVTVETIFIGEDHADYSLTNEELKTKYADSANNITAAISESTVQVSKAASDSELGSDRLEVRWNRAPHAKVTWTIGTYSDAACTSPYGTVLLTGIKDPDESNYLISDIADRDIFYVSADNSDKNADPMPVFGDSFEVKDNGIYTIDPNGNNVGMGFDNGLLLLTLNSEATITFDTDTFGGGYLGTPFFYSPIYKITYELNGGENDPDNPDSYLPGEEHTIKPPTRTGYKFTGWEEGDSISSTDTGNKTFTAGWDPLYTITYDANGGQGTMDDQEYLGSDSTKMSSDNKFTNPGKTFLGFKAYITDPETGEETPITDSNGNPLIFTSATDMAEYFKDKPGGTSIRMEAQWGITVTYRDPETGKTYQKTVIPEDGEEPTPPADPTRPGYTFKGWKRTVDEYGNIIYEAIWEKVSAPAKAKLIPNTGDIASAASASASLGAAALAAATIVRRKNED